MKVTLISHTPNAVDLLLFTKATRLNMQPSLLDEIAEWPEARKLGELAYMANTIPSSWEFVEYVFCIEGVSRAYTHQQVRTRAASYAQQSLRVVNVSDGEALPYVFTDRNMQSQAALTIISAVNRHILQAYRDLIAIGQPVEDARGILPTNIATNIVCKFNLRTMSELAKSRSGGRTQSEYRMVINAMCSAVLSVHPWAEGFLFPRGRDYFADIEDFAEREYGGDLVKKGALLKIVDKMRKELQS
jgi:flavin-dependent thymidylate synthase